MTEKERMALGSVFHHRDTSRVMPPHRPKKLLAHREGRTRSLQIHPLLDECADKSLTLYPIELGGLEC